jgi:hypothetical protein
MRHRFDVPSCVHPSKGHALKGEATMKNFGASSLEWTVLTLVAALSLVTACGDAHAYKIRGDTSGASEPLTNWNGTVLQLVRATTPCDLEDAGELIVIVCDEVEVPGKDLATLKSSCSSSREAEVSIDIIEGRSIIFDFSSVTKAGVFKAANFNGYVFTELVDAAPDIVGATVDRSVSTLELGDDALSVDGRVLHANFEGISFGEGSFLKIDLVFAEPGR